MHLVLKSSHAVGPLCFNRPANRSLIGNVLETESAKREVRLYQSSIHSNHIHLAIRGKRRKGIQSFLRVVPGRIAQGLTQAVKGSPLLERFWDYPIWSRILEWGRAFRIVLDYIFQNHLESQGLVPYQLRARNKSSPPNPSQ